jgi:ribosome maturation factor RimP
MIRKKEIEHIVNEVLEKDYFIVELKVSTANRIIVIIDSFLGASIDDCKKISRAIESNFDREEEDYELEVSTPGLGKAFKVTQQYTKNIGRKVIVQTNQGLELTGELVSFSDNIAELKEEKMIKPEGKKKKEKVEIIHKFNLSDVKSTKVVVSFK